MVLVVISLGVLFIGVVLITCFIVWLVVVFGLFRWFAYLLFCFVLVICCISLCGCCYVVVTCLLLSLMFWF